MATIGPEATLPREIREGLHHVLAAFSTHGGHEPDDIVLTTAPRLWLSWPKPGKLTIVDLSRITGRTVWQSESDVVSHIYRSALLAGWPDDLIRIQAASQSYSSTAKSKGRFVADLLLRDGDDSPVAVVEVKLGHAPLDVALTQARRYATSLGAPFAIATEGTKFLVTDTRTSGEFSTDSFPTPHQFGVTISQYLEKTALPEQETERDVVEFESINGLAKLFEEMESSNVLVDYTIPLAVNIRAVTNDTIGNLWKPTKRRRADFLEVLLASLTEHGRVTRLTAFVPRSVIGSMAHSDLRAHLSSRMKVAGVLELPLDVLAPMASIATSVVVLKDNEEVADHSTVFAALSSRGDLVEPLSQPWLQDFLAGLQGQAMSVGFRTQLVHDRAWTWAAQNPGSTQIENRLIQAFETAPLGELCSLILGVRLQTQGVESRGGTPVVRGRDLSAGTLAIESLSKMKIDPADLERSGVRVGDILIQRIGDAPRLVVAGRDLEGAVASSTVILLRPKDSRANSTVISEFLLSSIGQQLLVSRAQTATVPTLSLGSLRSLPIPLPKEDISEDLDLVRRVEDDLRTRADALAALRIGLFAIERIEEFRPRIAQLRQSARSVSLNLEQADSLDFRIRTLYPYPISYPYRTLASITVPSELYSEQLRVAEGIMAFLASVSMSLLDVEDRSVVRQLFVDRLRGGASAGTWRELARTASQPLSRYEGNPLARSLAALWTRRRAAMPDRAEGLVVARNDHHHGRGPRLEEEFTAATRDTAAILHQIMEDLSFLIDHPIRLVRDMDVVRGSRRVLLKVLRLTGDHPGLPQEQLEYDDPLPRDDLYIEVSPGRLHSLYPFVLSRNCQSCKAREVYFVDRWSGDHRPASLKSYERGHVEAIETVSIALSSW